jgi:ribosomal protein L34
VVSGQFKTFTGRIGIRSVLLGLLLALLATGMTPQASEATHQHTPSSLVNLTRTSPDTVQAGDIVGFSWEVGDTPAREITVLLSDRHGGRHFITWNDPVGASSGTATAIVDDTWAGGDVSLLTVEITAANGTYTMYNFWDWYSDAGLRAPNVNAAAARFNVVNPSDTSTPPSLMGFTRTSPDNAQVGDTVTIDWEVADVPVTKVQFELADSQRRRLDVLWEGSEASLSGTASAVVGPDWADGPVTITYILVQTPISKVFYERLGPVYMPSLSAPRPVTLDFASPVFHVANPRDTSLVPSLAAFSRTSPAAVAEGDAVTVDWQVAEAPATKVSFEFEDSALKKHFVVWEDPAGALSGTARATVDAFWASGTIRLRYVTLSGTNGSVTYRWDGDIQQQPHFFPPPSKEGLDFSAADMALGILATPLAPVFTDLDGTANDTYTIPTTEGIDYLAGEEVVPAGTYPGWLWHATTIAAREQPHYAITPGAESLWQYFFMTGPHEVSPAPVTFQDNDGAAVDTYSIPGVHGVDYLIDGKVVPAGTYRGSGTVTVTAAAQRDYFLAAGSIQQWSTTFSGESEHHELPAGSPFTDVPTDHQFYREIAWLEERRITTGWTHDNGTRTYQPQEPISRAAMAAFLCRLAAPEAYAAAGPVFQDVPTAHQFYREIAWLEAEKVTTGWTDDAGTRTYQPASSINRAAMAAFLFRLAAPEGYTPPAVSPFQDVPTNHQFYKEIAWLEAEKVTTGWTDDAGSRTYQPQSPINRAAMAAFLHRLSNGPD